MAIFLNSYYPINCTKYGKKALKSFPALHPLEDGSIRREPDLKSQYPGVSGLCRPRSMSDIGLKEGDIIIYKTNKTHYLTAILRAVKKLDSHEEAKEWYENKNIVVPSNCILEPHLPIKKTHARDYLKKVGKSLKGDKILEKNWDESYQIRASNSKSSYFFITESIFNAVKDKNKDFLKIDMVLREHSKDGKVNNTSFRPQELSKECYDEILNLI